MANLDVKRCAWLVLAIFLYSSDASYIEVCESVTSVYCSCELSYSDTYRLSCIMLQPVGVYDPIWRSIGKSDSITYLKLNARHPLKLEYIPPDLLGMDKLKTLVISEGNLGVLKSNSISGFKSLEELKLDGNEITGLDPHAISKLPKLKKLSLSENFLQELLDDSLSELLELELLYLDHNNISRIVACAFCNLQNLKELDLFQNQISDLTEYTFRGLRYLRRLDLYKNQIRILNDKVFHTMPRLVEIDLKDNLISHIAPRAFFGLEKLQRLTLNNNRLKFLPDEVFAPLTSLRSVELYNNEIEVLQGEVLYNTRHAKDPMFSLSFKENPYRCDCRMNWIAVFLALNTTSYQFRRELEEVRCTPEDGAKLLIAEFLNATDCKSSTIKPRTPPVSPFKYVSKATDTVPVELQSQRSNMASLSDQDDDARDDPHASDVQDNGDPGGATAHCSSIWTVLAVLCTLLLGRHGGVIS